MIVKILLTDSLEFNGTIHELKEKIRFHRERKFDFEWMDQNDFKFLSKTSVGTIMINYSPGAIDGIKGYGHIKEIKSGKTHIELKSKIRVELYFMVFVFSFIFFCGYMSGEGFPLWVYLLLPICLIWFWFVLRVQEKRLFENFKTYINQI